MPSTPKVSQERHATEDAPHRPYEPPQRALASLSALQSRARGIAAARQLGAFTGVAALCCLAPMGREVRL